MNEQKENYMDIFNNKEVGTSQININNIEKKEEKKEQEINTNELLPMYSDRLEEAEKLFDPLGNHPLPKEEDKKEEIEEKKEEKPKLEMQIQPLKGPDKIEEVEENISLTELDLEKASRSLSVNIIGNNALDKASKLLFIIMIFITLYEAFMIGYNIINKEEMLLIGISSILFIFSLIVLILSKLKRRITPIFGFILIIMMIFTIIKNDYFNLIIGILLIIPTVNYLSALIEKK